MQRLWKNPELRILLVIFVGAAALRLAAVLSRPMIQLDEAVYARLAENLAAGKGFVDLTGVTSVHFAPFFPLVVAAVSLVARDAVVSGYIVVILFGSLITVPTYLLGKELFGGRIGLMAAALVAVAPLMVDYSSRLYSESVYIFLLMLALYFGWRMLAKPALGDAFFAGLTLGAAYLTNPSPFLYLALFAALAVATGLKRGNLIRSARALAVLAGVFLLMAIPNILYIHSVTGQWTYTGKKANEHIFTVQHGLRYGTPEWERQAMTLTEDGRQEWQVRAEEGGDIITFFIQEPATAARMFVAQVNEVYTRQLAAVIPLWLLPLLGLGLFARVWEKGRGWAIGYVLATLSPVLVILAMYPTDRFFMPFLPPLLILVSLGWQRWESWSADSVDLCFEPELAGRLRRPASWLIAALVIAPVAIFGLGNLAGTKYETQYREAGEWIGAAAGEGKKVMSRWEATSSYYSGGISVPLPYADYERTTAYARSAGVDYLVISRQAIRDYRPELAGLEGPEANHPEWRLVHVVRPGTEKEVLIFQRLN